ncbi:MAG: hypothetical protein H7175_25820, partial [Burkholderiales bacterium]|nr:hypothetical protein [Anaerolineae bacterium]
VTYALTASIADLDLVRARLLTDILYRSGELLPFDRISDSQVQSRITFDFGTRYERLRQWIDKYQQGEALPLDAFFSRLFGEVLSQPKFGFHDNFDAANTAANLIESARSFRQTVTRIDTDVDIAAEYVRMVDKGVIANQYLNGRETDDENAVLIAPAYTFLMANQSVDYQFWLNIGSSGWGQRLHQPLTHPSVMSRQWHDGDVWTGEKENNWNQEAIAQLTLGLIRRCRKRVFMGFSQFGEQGIEQRGPLLMALQSMLRRLSKEVQQDV